MKTEINLRTREFVTAREFYWPRLAGTILLVLILSAAAVGTILVYLHINSLRHDLVFLSGRRDELRLRAAPVIELEQAIGRVKQIAAQDKELLEKVTPWSGYLREIKEAAGEGIRVERVAGSSDGSLIVTGSSSTLRGIAVYAQSLDALDFLNDVTIGNINLEQKEDRLGFTLGATVTTGGGLDRYEQAKR